MDEAKERRWRERIASLPDLLPGPLAWSGARSRPRWLDERKLPLLPGNVIGVVLSRHYDFQADRWSSSWESTTLTTSTDPFFVWGLDPGVFRAHYPRDRLGRLPKAGVMLRMSRRTLCRWMTTDPGWCRSFREVCTVEVIGSPLSRKARRVSLWQDSMR